jgi:hypothetical protein
MKMKNRSLKLSLYIGALIVPLMFINCGGTTKKDKPEASEINTLTKAEIRDGWKLLFDGQTFNGWRGIGRDHVPVGLWVIENGLIKKVNTGEVEKLPDGRPAEGGDLMTVDIFENFELTFEWKVNKSGNTGLKYNVSEEMSEKYGTKYSALGFEYQLMDHPVGTDAGELNPTHMTGSLYDLLPSKNIAMMPVGEFNSSRILVNGKHVEHWLNGTKVLEYELGSQELMDAYKVSKFKDIPGFCDKRKAHIILQNHNDESWFRNIKIRELK